MLWGKPSVLYHRFVKTVGYGQMQRNSNEAHNGWPYVGQEIRKKSAKSQVNAENIHKVYGKKCQKLNYIFAIFCTHYCEKRRHVMLEQ